jgi:hypothetical protein
MDVHPRLANALVHACKQRGDWRAYKTERGKGCVAEDNELADRLTRASPHHVSEFLRLGLAELANPGYPPSHTLFAKPGQYRWITITPLGIQVARKRFMLVMTTVRGKRGPRPLGFFRLEIWRRSWA